MNFHGGNDCMSQYSKTNSLRGMILCYLIERLISHERCSRI